ncbi:MAG: sugar phosphate nucleotidyltransferase, partial [Pseudomonadota bacterium]
ENYRIIGFEEKPEHPKPLPNDPTMCLASMGNYTFRTDFLFDQLRTDSKNLQSDHDFGKNIIPSIIKGNNVYAYRFADPESSKKAYWKDVGTLDSYWLANIELTTPVPQLNLYDPRWPIWTFQEQLPPAKFVFNDDDRRGCAIDSLVSGGCIISGSRIVSSVMYSNVRTHSYSVIEESVLLPESDVGRHCRLRRTIIDRGCHIPPNTEIGFDPEADRARGFRVTEGGVTLVTRSMLGQSVGGV